MLPATFDDPSGRAWVAFSDDQPIFGAEQTARFVIRRRRRFPWISRGPEVIQDEKAAKPERRFRSGDTVEMTLGARTMSWRYVPDANLGRMARVALTTAKVGTVLACLAAGVSVVNEIAWYAERSEMGGSPKTSALGREIRHNASQVYPAVEKKPSAYVEGLIRARAAGEDMKVFSQRWIAEHPQADQSEIKP